MKISAGLAVLFVVGCGGSSSDPGVANGPEGIIVVPAPLAAGASAQQPVIITPAISSCDPPPYPSIAAPAQPSASPPAPPPASAPPSASASPGPAPSSGTVANASSVVAGMAAGFRRCYNKGLQCDRDMDGMVRVTATIGPHGEVERALATSTHGLSQHVVDCVVGRVQSAQFSPPDGGGATIVIPVSFAPR